jgi:hypothetical protein
MAKFKFQLDSLKKFRERRLLVAKKDFLEVEGRRQDLLKEIKNAEAERLSVLGWSQDIGVGSLYLGTLSYGQSRKIQDLGEKIQKVDAEIERHRSWVAHLSKELKAVERLEEKKRQIFDDEKKRQERRFQDGWVVERWAQSKDPEVRDEDYEIIANDLEEEREEDNS